MLFRSRTMGNRPIEGLQGNQIANWINKNYDIQLPTNYPRRMTDQQVGQLFLKAAELSVQGGKLASGPTPIPTPGATDMSGVIAVITNLYNSTTNSAEKAALKKAAADLGITLP